MRVYFQTTEEKAKARKDRLSQSLTMSYKAYATSDAAKVGTAVPDDPFLARALVSDALKEALLRLDLTPVKFFNIANKKKAKFIDQDDVKG